MTGLTPSEDMGKTEARMGVYELANDVTAEQIKAVFFDRDALREPSYKLCQLNARGQRFYYVADEEGVELYPSVTTILKRVMPENRILTDWKVALGKEASEAYTMERARFGSFVHGQLQSLMINRTYNLDSMREALSKYAERESLPVSFAEEHIDEAKYDMLSFARWMKDYDVRPLAVEIALYHPVLKYAGMLDCVCSMRKYPVGDKHGDERVVAIVDFKTTTKDFRDEHAIQLGLYRDMWNLSFPDVPITEIANVSPKAWWNTARKQVSYNFEWQTDNGVLKQIPYLLELYKLLPEETRKIAVCGGMVSLDGDIDKNVAVLTMEDLVQKGREKMRQEEESDEDNLFPDE